MAQNRARLFSGKATEQIVAAVVWCQENATAYDIVAINMSFGSEFTYEDVCTGGIVGTVVDMAVNDGIAVVAATGNNGSSTGIALPACLSNVIPVSATNDDDTRRPTANYNHLVKLFAPGEAINSTCIAAQDPDSDGYCEKSGTSMSTPMVAGAIAIIRQFLDIVNDTMTPAEMEQLLFDTGDPIVDLPFSEHRRINIYAAIQSLIDEYFPCPADVVPPGGDGQVSIADINFILSAYGQPCDDCPADITPLGGDGQVTIADINSVLTAFGPCLVD